MCLFVPPAQEAALSSGMSSQSVFSSKMMAEFAEPMT